MLVADDVDIVFPQTVTTHILNYLKSVFNCYTALHEQLAEAE